MMVAWVTGRKKALARAVAMFVADAAGEAWDRMTPARRRWYEAGAREQVEEWLAAGVLASFEYEYRETEDPSPDALGSGGLPPADRGVDEI